MSETFKQNSSENIESSGMNGEAERGTAKKTLIKKISHLDECDISDVESIAAGIKESNLTDAEISSALAKSVPFDFADFSQKFLPNIEQLGDRLEKPDLPKLPEIREKVKKEIKSSFKSFIEGQSGGDFGKTAAAIKQAAEYYGFGNEDIGNWFKESVFAKSLEYNADGVVDRICALSKEAAIGENFLQEATDSFVSRIFERMNSKDNKYDYSELFVEIFQKLPVSDSVRNRPDIQEYSLGVVNDFVKEINSSSSIPLRPGRGDNKFRKKKLACFSLPLPEFFELEDKKAALAAMKALLAEEKFSEAETIKKIAIAYKFLKYHADVINPLINDRILEHLASMDKECAVIACSLAEEFPEILTEQIKEKALSEMHGLLAEGAFAVARRFAETFDFGKDILSHYVDDHLVHLIKYKENEIGDFVKQFKISQDELSLCAKRVVADYMKSGSENNITKICKKYFPGQDKKEIVQTIYGEYFKNKDLLDSANEECIKTLALEYYDFPPDKFEIDALKTIIFGKIECIGRMIYDCQGIYQNYVDKIIKTIESDKVSNAEKTKAFTALVFLSKAFEFKAYKQLYKIILAEENNAADDLLTKEFKKIAYEHLKKRDPELDELIKNFDPAEIEKIIDSKLNLGIVIQIKKALVKHKQTADVETIFWCFKELPESLIDKPDYIFSNYSLDEVKAITEMNLDLGGMVKVKKIFEKYDIKISFEEISNFVNHTSNKITGGPVEIAEDALKIFGIEDVKKLLAGNCSLGYAVEMKRFIDGEVRILDDPKEDDNLRKIIKKDELKGIIAATKAGDIKFFAETIKAGFSLEEIERFPFLVSPLAGK